LDLLARLNAGYFGNVIVIQPFRMIADEIKDLLFVCFFLTS
jgi:hypothetical protein